MPNPNVMAGTNRLRHSIKALRDHWLAIEATWGDEVRRRFEERYLTPLDPATDAAIAGLLKFGEVLDRVRRDLSDRSESP